MRVYVIERENNNMCLCEYLGGYEKGGREKNNVQESQSAFTLVRFMQ